MKHHKFCSEVFDVLLDSMLEIQFLRESTDNAIPLKTLAQLRKQVKIIPFNCLSYRVYSGKADLTLD